MAKTLSQWDEAALQSEWQYLYQERLGILCGKETPTPEQELMAKREADEAVMNLRKSG